MSVYDVLGVHDPGAEGGTDVTDAEVQDYNERRRLFKLPELTNEAAADAIRRERAAVDAFKAGHPLRWAEAEAQAEISDGWDQLHRTTGK